MTGEKCSAVSNQQSAVSDQIKGTGYFFSPFEHDELAAFEWDRQRHRRRDNVLDRHRLLMLRRSSLGN